MMLIVHKSIGLLPSEYPPFMKLQLQNNPLDKWVDSQMYLKHDLSVVV